MHLLLYSLYGVDWFIQNYFTFMTFPFIYLCFELRFCMLQGEQSPSKCVWVIHLMTVKYSFVYRNRLFMCAG